MKERPEAPPDVAVDLYERAFVADPHSTWETLRSNCPVAHSTTHDGFWIVTRYDDVVDVAQQPDTFSSRCIVVPRETMGLELAKQPPINLDPPEHLPFRRSLISAFTAKEAQRWEPTARQAAREAIASFIDKGSCDPATDYAKRIPVAVMCALLGVPTEKEPEFTRWARELFESGDMAVTQNAGQQLAAYMGSLVGDRRTAPGEDLISQLQAEEAAISDEELAKASSLILTAGLDTTWSVIGNALLHLARNPEDRDRLLQNPELIISATEEFLRYFTPSSVARVTTETVEIGGRRIESGESVLMSFPAANRDPQMFERAETVVLDRPTNRHIAFGAGPHRCLGASLARMQIRVSLSEWLAAIPEFEESQEDSVEFSPGQTWGPRSFHVRFPMRNQSRSFSPATF
jgi:cytochrome P450